MRLTRWLIRYLAGCVAATLIALLTFRVCCCQSLIALLIITRVCRCHPFLLALCGCVAATPHFMLGCTQQPVVPFTAKYCVLFGSYGVCSVTVLLNKNFHLVHHC